jgi:thiol:disulfide interchange protein DsbD
LVVSSKVEGAWPEAAAPPALPSPALEAALAQNKLDVAAATAAAAPWLSASFGLALLGAILGGLILNLMPCVLPVLAIKLLSFAPKKIIDSKSSIAQVKIESTGAAIIYSDQTLSFRGSSGLFAVGVIGTFTALGSILLALRAAGQSLGWGFQLQSPPMVLALAVLFLLVGLNLFEAFELRIFLPQRWVNFQSNNPSVGALASGILAVLIAAPCTAPFMGASLGLAIVLPTLQALLIFVFLGVGMALPFIALAFFPSIGTWLLKVLPKPGPWMSVMQQLLAWPVFGTVLWLMWIYAQQTSVNRAFAVLGSLTLLVALTWSLNLPRGWPRRIMAAIFAALMLISYGLWDAGVDAATATATATAVTADTSSSQAAWSDWSPEKQQEARQAGRPIFVDFTAAWCLTCQVNKSSTLHREDVMALFKAKNVLLLRADWTKPNDKIAAELAKLGRSGLPVYAFYLPGSNTPQLLSEVLTTDIIKQALSVL